MKFKKMHRTHHLQLSNPLAGIAALSLLAPCQTLGKEKEARPNVLMICVDDLNDWIGCMGNIPSAKTPHIDRLASRGVLFTNAHCQAPLSGPSRASLMTGLRPSTTGIYGQINDADIRMASRTTHDILFLPEYFEKYGYHTLGVGKIFHEHAPAGVFRESGGRVKGFGPHPPSGKRFHWNRPGTQTDWGAFPATDEEMPDYQSAQWAVKQLNRQFDQPFFLAVGFIRPHVPWYVPQKWFDLYPIETIALPPCKVDDKNDIPDIALEMDRWDMMPTTEWAINSGQWKYMVQAYLACVSFVDHCIGEVLEALDNSGYGDNTVVVLFSDNGYRMGQKGVFAKHCLWQEATRVPLIVSCPGMKSRLACNEPVELLDIYPTLADLCALPANPKNEGKSLKPFLMDDRQKASNSAVTTWGRNNHAVVSGHYRYIRYEDLSEELYDHRVDRYEWNNIAGMPKNNSIKKKLGKNIPAQDALWSKKSAYDINDYFTMQKKEQSEE